MFEPRGNKITATLLITIRTLFITIRTFFITVSFSVDEDHLRLSFSFNSSSIKFYGVLPKQKRFMTSSLWVFYCKKKRRDTQYHPIETVQPKRPKIRQKCIKCHKLVWHTHTFQWRKI